MKLRQKGKIQRKTKIVNLIPLKNLLDEIYSDHESKKVKDRMNTLLSWIATLSILLAQFAVAQGKNLACFS